MSFVSVIIITVLVAILLSPVFLPDPPVVDDVTELPENLQKWHGQGKYMKVGEFNIFYIHERCRRKDLVNPPTFAIVHGFPSSSYEYHKVLIDLLNYGDVFVHDHLGFGFSDKPKHNYTYSIGDAAENTLTAWRKVGLKDAHVVSHDMGDTILTEILARRHKDLLPDYFKGFFRSVTFTNGGMKYSLINFRLGQILAKNVYFGSYFSSLSCKLQFNRYFMTKQLKSLWGENVDTAIRDRDIESLAMINDFRGGSLLLHKTIYYLWDRAHFEYRWFAALAHMDVPTRFIWGDSDAVSPVEIPHFFKTFVPNAKVSLVKGGGHFFMLEQPETWIKVITSILD